MNESKKDIILKRLQTTGVLRAKDLKGSGISGAYLNKLYADGILDRPSRGLYTLPDAEPSEFRTIVEACKRVPHGIVCLLSALQLHELTTQAPFEVWLAIDGKDRKPQIDYPPLHIVRFSAKARTQGIQERELEGVQVSLTNPARTVVDCFKYRNKIGLDVALEALKDGLAQRKMSVDELWQAAEICRMRNVMRPYLEAAT